MPDPHTVETEGKLDCKWQDDGTCKLQMSAGNSSMAVYLTPDAVAWLVKELQAGGV
jgi:hypothetical protein|tara:strand:- start:10856 stop:11023 length:168 start_codon:yes stop_codon:yes gene_type:complete